MHPTSIWQYFSATLVVLSLINCSSACPSVCNCKWKNGKQTAECNGKGLTVIPSDLDPMTQVIDISRNSFTELPNRSFQTKNLVNLQKIFITECDISKVAHDAFYQLRNLVELDLSGNKLQYIPTDSFQDCPNLRRLQLAHNPISQIDSGVFSSLPHLTYLNLANCAIDVLKPGALEGLNSLEYLELNDNKLTTLSIDVLQPLTNMQDLNLHNNPWYCDCKIRYVRTWMIDQKIPLSIPPHCEAPALVRGVSWSSMSLDDFACAPKIIHSNSERTATLGHNTTIICQVDASPRASIFWEVGGKSLKNLSYTPELKSKYSIVNKEVPKQSSVLYLYNIAESDSDNYACFAENKAGTASMNFTLTVIFPDHYGSWNTLSVTLLLVGVIVVVIIATVAILFLVYHPTPLPFGTKLNRRNVLQQLSEKKQDSVEMNDVRQDKEEKDLKVLDKQPRHETGSSGYGSDQLTPDLVSKISDMNNGPSLSTSTLSCNHHDSELIDGYGSNIDHWSLPKSKRPARYDSSPLGNNVYAEIYLNPCYGKEDNPYNYALQAAGVHQLPPDCTIDRYLPQNDRVRDLRNGYEYVSREELSTASGHEDTLKRSPLVVANASGHYTLPSKNRFSPDEGYAEEGLEGTEV